MLESILSLPRTFGSDLCQLVKHNAYSYSLCSFNYRFPSKNNVVADLWIYSRPIKKQTTNYYLSTDYELWNKGSQLPKGKMPNKSIAIVLEPKAIS